MVKCFAADGDLYSHFENRERASTVDHGLPACLKASIYVLQILVKPALQSEALHVKWGFAGFKDDWMDHN